MDNHSEEYLRTKRRIKHWLDVKIEEDILANSVKHNTRKRLIAVISSCTIAATFIFALMFYGFDVGNNKSLDITWHEVTTNYGEKKSALLPDGTKIWLHNESRLLYPSAFVGKTRQVFASGEVFAEVHKDKSHPFLLSSNGVNVVVKGTTFNFRSYPEATEVELTLLEGSVDMNLLVGEKKKVISLTPGQIVKVNFLDEKISMFSTDPSKYVAWKDTRVLYFNDDTLENIIKELENEFNIRVFVTSKSLLKTRYYASFVNGETPDQIFNALNTTGMMRIKKTDNNYYIYPNN